MVTSLNMKETEMDYRGSKSTIFLVSIVFLILVSLLVFALSYLISFILTLLILQFSYASPEEEVLLFSNSSLLVVFPLRASGFIRKIFSYTSVLLVDVRKAALLLLPAKQGDEKLLQGRQAVVNGGFRVYSTNSSSVAGANLRRQPVKIYINADLDKVLILQDNKGKCGVYRWTNTTNGNSYIGSSINLERRLKGYFSIYFLESEIKKGRSMINSALLKYGYSNFTLEILEYCDSSEAVPSLREREQYYLDLFKPEYNILSTAGSWLGSKHSEEAKAKMSAVKLGNKNATGGKGRIRAEGAGSPSVAVEVFDQETGMKTIYPSMSGVGKALGVPSGSIRMYFSSNTQKPYKGRYLLQKLAGNSRGFHTMVVKEQRVDGSWSIKPRLVDLKCILGGFERNRGIKLGFNMQQGWNSSVKIPSKQFDLKKFSTYNSTIINPGVWSGLIDGEGSFSIIVDRNKTRKLLLGGFNFLYYRGLEALRSPASSCSRERERNIPRFQLSYLFKFPRQTRSNQLIVKKFSACISVNLWITLDLNSLLSPSALPGARQSLWGLSFAYAYGAGHIRNKEVRRDSWVTTHKYTPHISKRLLSNKLSLRRYSTTSVGREDNFYEWFCGLTDGEGSFYIKSTGSRTFSFRFQLGLHKDDLELLKFIQKTLGIGRIFTYRSQSYFDVTKQEDVARIIDIFSNYPLNTHKHFNFLDFKKAYELYVSNKERTLEFVFEINTLKRGMNTNRSYFGTTESRKFRISPYW
jgi:hypothetical protein